MSGALESATQDVQTSQGRRYQPGTDDSVFEEAFRQCRQSNEKLAKILPPNDAALLRRIPDRPELKVINAEAVKSFIEDKAKESRQRNEWLRFKWLPKTVESLARFTFNIRDLVSPLTSLNPECAVVLGCLMVISKTIVLKQEKLEAVSDIFARLVQVTDSLDLCNVSISSSPDKVRLQLAKVYIAILELVVIVTEYCAIGRTSKIVDALTANTKYDFKKGLQEVESAWGTLRFLMQAASGVLQIDTYDLLQNQAKKVDYVAAELSNMQSQIASLRLSIDTLQLDQRKMHMLQLRQHNKAVMHTLLPLYVTMNEEIQHWKGRQFRTSPKDHWEVNGVLEYLEAWSSLPHASILAIFGPTRGRDSWVTEFALDTIQAFQVQNELVTFVLCDRSRVKQYSPKTLIKILICQILEQRPTLVLEEPDLFTLHHCQSAVELNQLCNLLGRMISRIDRIAIIIDRIESCRQDQGNEKDEIFEFLVGIVEILGKGAKIIITSANPLPTAPPHNVPISMCQISTQQISSSSSYRRYPKSLLLDLFRVNDGWMCMCWGWMKLFYRGKLDGRFWFNAIHEASNMMKGNFSLGFYERDLAYAGKLPQMTIKTAMHRKGGRFSPRRTPVFIQR
ncbi:hypothetical protein LTS17_009468 [Exophiala oligosperma]